MARNANGGSLEKATIIENVRLAGKYFRISFEVPPSYLAARPGQFVMLRLDMRKDPLLGRPFSIYSLYEYGPYAACSVLYKAVGKMTDLLSSKAPGDSLFVLGPLGRGFDLSRSLSKTVLVAGGTGVAPISFLARTLSGMGRSGLAFYYGARSEQDLIGLDGLDGVSEPGISAPELRICTEDCSRGEQGVVTELLARDIASFNPEGTGIYACGPLPMLRSLRSVLEINPMPVQVSIEERMACGMGACLACAVPSANKQDWYVRACQEGPVFNLDEVELEC